MPLQNIQSRLRPATSTPSTCHWSYHQQPRLSHASPLRRNKARVQQTLVLAAFHHGKHSPTIPFTSAVRADHFARKYRNNTRYFDYGNRAKRTTDRLSDKDRNIYLTLTDSYPTPTRLTPSAPPTRPPSTAPYPSRSDPSPTAHDPEPDETKQEKWAHLQEQGEAEQRGRMRRQKRSGSASHLKSHRGTPAVAKGKGMQYPPLSDQHPYSLPHPKTLRTKLKQGRS